MSFASLIIFCSTYLLAAATPGPGIAALLARVMGRGTKGIPAFIAGFVVGDLFWCTLAVTGLAVLAQTFHSLFVVIKYMGAAYLLFLAFKLWTGVPEPMQNTVVSKGQDSFESFLSGLAITLGNPKVMVFFMALLPTLVDLNTISVFGYLEIAMIICVGLSCVLGTYAIAASRARRLLSSHRSHKIINRTTGVVMTGSAAAIAMNSVAWVLLSRFNNTLEGITPFGHNPST